MNQANTIGSLAFNPSCTDLAVNVFISPDNIHSANIEAYSQYIRAIDRLPVFVAPERRNGHYLSNPGHLARVGETSGARLDCVPLGKFHGSGYWYISSIFQGSYLHSPCTMPAQDSKETTKSIWTMLKTLLFSNIMLAEAVLSVSVYLRPGSSQITPTSLALQTLHILSHLSFIISEFGGVTTTTQGFEHLKKTFYLALDILAHGDGEHGDSGMKAEAYVQQSCFALNSQRAESGGSHYSFFF